MSTLADASEIETAEEQFARHAGMLRELQELGMRMARAVASQAEAAAQAGELESGAATLALGRAGKMVRQCIALERDLSQSLNAAAEAAASAPQSREEASQSRRKLWQRLWYLYGRGTVRDALEKVIVHDPRLSESDAERLLGDLKDRLDRETLEMGEDFHIHEIVIRLCQEMDIEIDWTLFESHGWAEDLVGFAKTRRDGAVNVWNWRERPP